MTAPLITVITPTQTSRLDRLATVCIPSVKAQTYPNVRHLLISDGFSPEILHLAEKLDLDYSFVHKSTGQHWGGNQRAHGISCAGGEIIAYLDDDDKFMPEHLRVLGRLLIAPHQPAWAYAGVTWHREGDTRHCWSDPPEPGNCSSILAHWKSLHAPWRDGPREDWDLISTWLEAGVPYATTRGVTAHAYGHDEHGHYYD